MCIRDSVNPDEETIKKYEAKAKAYAEEKEALKVLVNAKSITKDGHKVELAGNIGGFKDCLLYTSFMGNQIIMIKDIFLHFFI